MIILYGLEMRESEVEVLMFEIQKIEAIILEKLRFNYSFSCAVSRKERDAEPAPNLNWNDRKRCEDIAKIPAFLRTYFTLSEIREWLGKNVRDETSDKLIYECLDGLAKRGKVIFLQVNHLWDARFDNFQFYTEVGLGWSSFAVVDNKTQVTRFYQDTPLSKNEFTEGKGILEIKKAVEAAFKLQRKSMELRFGTPPDLNIERKLWRDEHDSKTQIGAAQIAIAKALEKVV